MCPPLKTQAEKKRKKVVCSCLFCKWNLTLTHPSLSHPSAENPKKRKKKNNRKKYNRSSSPVCRSLIPVQTHTSFCTGRVGRCPVDGAGEAERECMCVCVHARPHSVVVLVVLFALLDAVAVLLLLVLLLRVGDVPLRVVVHHSLGLVDLELQQHTKSLERGTKYFECIPARSAFTRTSMQKCNIWTLDTLNKRHIGVVAEAVERRWNTSAGQHATGRCGLF